ncbi:MAG: hypothetical protein IJF83_06080 [Methanobrevibacter sp.]|nr:hypothetical protein [Methanobrevibacter sp.]
MTLTLTALKILNNSMEVRITENNEYTTITVPANNNPQTITIEKEVTTQRILLTFIFRKNNIIAYIDNINLNTQ